jgi:tryptophanyl-tRNA synthetase
MNTQNDTIEAVRPIVLTGDRPTGALHLGHHAGSLATRVAIQRTHDQTVLVADVQALTDNARDPLRIRANVLEVVADYLAVGLDPSLTTICLQSAIPAIARLGALYLNLVSVGRLERNPTVRAEMAQKGMERDVPAGFLCYPAHQAADITAFAATHVPCGEDQLPMLEMSNEIAERINRIAGRDVVPTCRAMLSSVGRLPGIDGRAKASKSLGNAISLSATAEEVQAAVRAMYTDPDHVKVSDPGRVEGNVVFAHLDAFDADHKELAELKAHYRRGGLGDMVLKRRLAAILEDLIAPMRERRAALAARPDDLMDVLREGTRKAVERTEPIAGEIEEALGVMRLR